MMQSLSGKRTGPARGARLVPEARYGVTTTERSDASNVAASFG